MRVAVSTALRSERQRVLDLVRDIGGKALDGVHALPQRVGHLAQRAREIADLVAAAGEVGDLDPAPAAARALGRGGEAADRPGDGAGEIEATAARVTSSATPKIRSRSSRTVRSSSSISPLPVDSMTAPSTCL